MNKTTRRWIALGIIMFGMLIYTKSGAESAIFYILMMLYWDKMFEYK